MTTVTIYAYPGNAGANKAKIAGKYGGVHVELKPIQMGTENKTPEFLKKNPFGQVPTADTPDGPLFESNAIARYVARAGTEAKTLLGATNYEAALIDQWVDVLRSNEVAVFPWLGQTLGYVPYDEASWNKSKESTIRLLNVLNAILSSSHFIAGGHATLADVIVVCNCYNFFALVWDPEFIKPYTHVVEWYKRCLALPQFKEVLGEPKFATEPAQPKK